MVTPNWIWDCERLQKRLPCEQYGIRNLGGWGGDQGSLWGLGGPYGTLGVPMGAAGLYGDGGVLGGLI